MINIIVSGIGGRMGQRIGTLILSEEDMQLVGAIEAEGTEYIGKDAGEVLGKGKIGIYVSDNLEKIIERGDVLIEFTQPKASIDHLKIVRDYKKAMVIGTTGFNEDEKREIDALAREVPLVMAPNMSVGVNVMFKIASDIVELMGPGYDIEIIEAHHRMKKDAPSGTALKLAEVVSKARGLKLDDVAKYHREGFIGERPQDEIGIQTIRAGDIVGEHTLIVAGPGERIELTHRAHSRDNFARGAIRAARWVVSKSPGLYDMWDVLGLRG